MSRRTPGSPTIRIDPEVGQTIFHARFIIGTWRPGRVTANEALRVLLAVNNLHRVGQGPPTSEPDPVEPPCTVTT